MSFPVKRLLRPLASYVRNGLLGVVVGYDVAPRKLIALTFDDGPNPSYTVPILDLLDVYDVKATFFLLGRNADLFPGVAAEIVERGHAVGSHTYNHTRLQGLGLPAVAREVRNGQGVIYRAAGIRPALFRPPHGALDLTSFVTVRLMGLRPVLWSVSGQDWMGDIGDGIAQRITAEASPGAIILLHDGSRDVTDAQAGDRSQTVVAVRVVVEALLAAGYGFRTIPQMAEFGARQVHYAYAPR